MPYPRRLLSEGEAVVIELHPHWRRLVIPLGLIPLVVGLVAYFEAIAPAGRWHHPVQWSLLGVGLAVLAWFSLRPYLRWLTKHYVLTTRRVLLREGLLARHGRDIPLNRINDVTFSHTMVERLIGSGTLTIESAGERGQVVLRDIPRVEKVQRTLYDLVAADEQNRPNRVEDDEDHPDWPAP